jgi:hypothetical protein
MRSRAAAWRGQWRMTSAMQAFRTESRCLLLGALSPGFADVIIRTAVAMLDIIIVLTSSEFIDT